MPYVEIVAAFTRKTTEATGQWSRFAENTDEKRKLKKKLELQQMLSLRCKQNTEISFVC